MVTAIVLLVLVIVLLSFGLLFACAKIEQVQVEVREARDAEHDECLAAVTWHVKHEFAAIVLEQAARDWDAIEHQAHLQRLAREKYRAGGPSMPVIWMKDRAEKMREKVQS